MGEVAPRVALVTGASRGIGRGIAVALARDGWRVAVNYNANREAAETTAAEVERNGGTPHLVHGDVSLPEHRRGLVDATVEAFGTIHLLVNNAGVTSRGRDDILQAREDNLDWLFATNLKGPFFLTQAVAGHMLEADDPAGRMIVNISSISGYTVSTNRADYCMAKAAIGMMTELWAARLADHGIRVYEVRPGIIESDMTAPVREKYDRLIHHSDPPLQPIRRWGTPDDVGRTVAAVAEGGLPFSTGETINVDGGFHLRQI